MYEEPNLVKKLNEMVATLKDKFHIIDSGADIHILKSGRTRVKLSLLLEDRPYQRGDTVPMAVTSKDM